MSESLPDRSDAEWLRDFDERNKDVTEDDLAEALERLVRPPALNLLDPANSGDLEAARYLLKRRQRQPDERNADA